MLAPWSRRAADGEAQLRSCRGPPGSALSSQAAPGADRAFSKRGLAPLHREAVEPSRDVHTCLLPMCAALPVTGAARILKPLPKGQSVKRVTLRMFLGMSPATIVVSYRLTAGLPRRRPNYQLRRRILMSPSPRSRQPAIARRAAATTLLRLTRRRASSRPAAGCWRIEDGPGLHDRRRRGQLERAEIARGRRRLLHGRLRLTFRF